MRELFEAVLLTFLGAGVVLAQEGSMARKKRF